MTMYLKADTIRIPERAIALMRAGLVPVVTRGVAETLRLAPAYPQDRRSDLWQTAETVGAAPHTHIRPLRAHVAR